MRRLVKRVLEKVGFGLGREAGWRDFDVFERELLRDVGPYTLTNPERIVVLSRAVRYILKAGLGGAVVECGVWKGGSMMAIAKTMLREGATDRDLYLFDTFEGMPEPSEHDRSVFGVSAKKQFDRTRTGRDSSNWARAGLSETRQNVESTGYPPLRLHFVAGKVEDTLPDAAPERIALLRLDTDWYQSTKHELESLWPRVVPGGIVIFDDYGHWEGCRRAVDEYFAASGIVPFLNRIDYTARLTIKT